MKIKKVLALLGGTQYGVLTRFTLHIIEGFRKLGIDVDVLNLPDKESFDTKLYIAKYDLVV